LDGNKLKFNTIDQALDYIYSFINLEKSIEKKNVQKEYSLENIKYILKFFNNPQNNMKIIHIAGTKGKGSTTYFVSYLLKQLGYNVLSFVSPHLVKPNERILFNLDPISDSNLILIVNKIESILSINNLIPTTFELFFLIYLIFSKEIKADFLVIEVGLGGRLDCTNIVDPLISVITSISYDHVNILGNTIKKIAFEKGGIIKENKKTVLSRQSYNCKNIFKKICKEKNSQFFDSEKYYKILKYQLNTNGIIFDFKFRKKIIHNIKLSIYGYHQIENFMTAFLTVSLINNKVIEILNENKNIDLIIPARIELINKNPYIIADVAHNRDSAKKLKNTLKSHFKNIKWVVLSGMTSEKDYKGFFKEIKSIAEEIIITKPSDFKKSNPEKVYNEAKKIFNKSLYIENINDAIKCAINKKKNLLITGSFYISGPFIEYFKNYSLK
jgi:dihydrofolate synthase / folylpolyglutamate synthase